MSDAGELMLLSMLSPELHCKWHLAKWQQALITTIVFCGYLLASPFWGKFADKYGRKTVSVVFRSSGQISCCFWPYNVDGGAKYLALDQMATSSHHYHSVLWICGNLLASPFWGKFADKYGRKTVSVDVRREKCFFCQVDDKDKE